jgi:hypothetical protein
MQIQIDLGNLAVGIGTVFVAGVTLFISLKTLRQNEKFNSERSRREADRRLAEMRLKWIEELRNELAEYCAIATDKAALLIEVRRTGESEDSFKTVVVIQGKLMRLRSKIMTMLNAEEAAHSEAIKVLDRIWVAENENEVMPIDLVNAARAIFKIEWDRLNSEIKS